MSSWMLTFAYICSSVSSIYDILDRVALCKRYRNSAGYTRLPRKTRLKWLSSDSDGMILNCMWHDIIRVRTKLLGSARLNLLDPTQRLHRLTGSLSYGLPNRNPELPIFDLDAWNPAPKARFTYSSSPFIL
jgi:hypothetical protein